MMMHWTMENGDRDDLNG